MTRWLCIYDDGSDIGNVAILDAETAEAAQEAFARRLGYTWPPPFPSGQYAYVVRPLDLLPSGWVYLH